MNAGVRLHHENINDCHVPGSRISEGSQLLNSDMTDIIISTQAHGHHHICEGKTSHHKPQVSLQYPILFGWDRCLNLVI